MAVVMRATDIASLKDRTMEFLRSYGHLDEPEREPDFRDADFPGFCDSLAAAHPWYRDDPWHYQPAKTGEEVYEEHYNRMQKGVPVIMWKDFEGMLNEEIPDSEEYVLVDIGRRGI